MANLDILTLSQGLSVSSVNNGMPDLVRIYDSSAVEVNGVYTVNSLARILLTIAFGSGYSQT